MTVAASTAQIAVNGTLPPESATAPTGSVATLDVTGGPANPADWVGIYAAGAPDGSFLAWTYLAGSATLPATGVANASLTFTLPESAGAYEARLFADNGYGRLTTSAPINVIATAHVTVNGVTAPAEVIVQPGEIVTVHVSGAPGNTTDWVSLAQGGSSDGSYLAWQYLNGSNTPLVAPLTDATITFTVPTTPATYEVRLFANNGYGRLATSGPVRAQTATSGCTDTVATTGVTSGPSGTSGAIGVTTSDPSCAWTATSDSVWVTIGGLSGPYSGQVLADNPAGYWRFN